MLAMAPFANAYIGVGRWQQNVSIFPPEERET